jgi:hypothetical protein
VIARRGSGRARIIGPRVSAGGAGVAIVGRECLVARLFVVIGLAAALAGCAQAPQSGGTSFFVLCDQARAQARQGDPAGSAATLNKFTDVRDVVNCQLLLDRDAGREPLSGA